MLLKGETTAFKVAISKAECEALANVEAAHHDISGSLLKQSKEGTWRQHFFWTKHNFLVFSNKAGGVVISGVDLRASDCVIELVEYEAHDGRMLEAIKVVGRRDGGAPSDDGLPDPDPELITLDLRVPHPESVHDEDEPTTEHWVATLLAAQRDLRDKVAEMQKDRFRLMMHPIDVSHATRFCAKLELASSSAQTKMLKAEFKALPDAKKKVRAVASFGCVGCVLAERRMLLRARSTTAPSHSNRARTHPRTTHAHHAQRGVVN